MVPEQETCIRWYVMHVNLKAVFLERQVGEEVKTRGKNSLRRSHDNHCEINTQITCKSLHI